MERKLVELLDRIEVPESTAKKAEEMLMRELLHNEPEQIKTEDRRVQVEMKRRQPHWLKVMEASAAAIALAAGITAAAHVFHTEGQNTVVITPVMPTQQSTPSPAWNQEIITSLKEGNLYELKEGKNQVDLDLDGTAEEVVLKNIMTGTSVNEFEITVGDQTIKGEVDREEGLKLRIGMLTRKKDSIQLLFTSQYLSDDYITEVYNYEDKKLVKVGSFAEEVDQIKIGGDGSFEIVQPGGVLGRTKTSYISMMENPHTDKEITGAYWLQEIDEFEQTIDYQYEITVLEDVTVYKYRENSPGSEVAMKLKAGDTVKTVKIIEEQWLCIENQKGEQGYVEVHLDNLEIDGKSVPAWQVFDGLPFAG